MSDFVYELGLPLSFWFEVGLIVPIGLAVALLAVAIQRAQERHKYRAWRGMAQSSSRQGLAGKASAAIRNVPAD
jgi:hypothetical protein